MQKVLLDFGCGRKRTESKIVTTYIVFPGVIFFILFWLMVSWLFNLLPIFYEILLWLEKNWIGMWTS